MEGLCLEGGIWDNLSFRERLNGKSYKSVKFEFLILIKLFIGWLHYASNKVELIDIDSASKGTSTKDVCRMVDFMYQPDGLGEKSILACGALGGKNRRNFKKQWLGRGFAHICSMLETFVSLNVLEEWHYHYARYLLFIDIFI